MFCDALDLAPGALIYFFVSSREGAYWKGVALISLKEKHASVKKHFNEHNRKCYNGNNGSYNSLLYLIPP